MYVVTQRTVYEYPTTNILYVLVPLCNVKTAHVVSSYYSTRLVRTVVKAKLEKSIAKKSSTKAKALLQCYRVLSQ